MKYSTFLRRELLLGGMCILPMVSLFVPMEIQASNKFPSAYSNTYTLVNVTGKVLDENGKPIPGATVMIKGTKTGVKTDNQGEFRINVPPEQSVLVITYVGYEAQEVDVRGRQNISITMKPGAAIEEVVVSVGYGTRKSSEVVGSIASIKGEELMDIPAPNLAGAMRNRIAGVGVSQVSGRPGSGISLNIRNSATSSTASGVGVTAEPLYIVDGIIVDKEAFDNIDASMVEDISFLKDAAAAIYGASGAKGVVLVTTKRGKAGKPSITYNGYVGTSDAAQRPEMLTAYQHAVLMNETNSINNTASSSFFSPEDLALIQGLNYKSWFDEMWQASLTQRHNLSISGGSEKITFFAGGSYQNENANYAGMKFDKYSFRSGLTADFGKGLRADVNFNVDHNIRLAQHNLTENDATYFESIISIPQWVPMKIDDMYVNYNGKNPMATVESGYYNNRKSKAYRINASLTYTPEFIKGITARFQISQGSGSTNSRTYNPPYNLYNFERTGNNNELFTNVLNPETPSFGYPTVQNSRLTPGLGEDNSYQGFLTLQYANTFGKHGISALAGGEQSERNSDMLSVYWNNQLIPGGEDWWAFDSNTLTRNNINRFESAKRSFFGRFSYDFDKKYFIEGVARWDASSNFATGNRWGFSPSIGASWIASRENFFESLSSYITFLKFKVNWGITGDDRVDQRLWQERYLIDTSNGYLYGNSNGNALNPGRTPNIGITWEKKRTINFGVEMTLFNTLDINAEFFQNRGYDVFDMGGNDILPLYAGYLAPIINYQERFNWGSEFTVGYRTKFGQDVNFNASVNFGYGNSLISRALYAPGKILELNIEDNLTTAFGTDPRKYNSGNFGLISNGMFRTQEEVDAFMAQHPNYRTYNAIPQPGWLSYEDTNGDGVINDWDKTTMYENNNPFISTGINLGVGYKAFNLSTNIFAQFGGRVFYDSRARIAPSMTRNILSIWEDRWTPANTNGWLPRFDDPSLTRNSTFWAVDGTTIRVNNLTLSYRLPSSIANRVGLANARILATGNNLWTLVNPLKYKDPYTSSAYDYPILRTISVGLSLNL
ncbi:SusC/RagA family TonB-linked outer membrane protein [Sphingobacterium lactis]|uniref:TonB-linked outer membrane protein, SusC/RagA family n=1 Tax=Sphingobacterium lactis TaxID=797291 RepID=A0A1H6CJ03_9SPHI|nr:SusC/RagA family TonB-linked outer membrane protein [Sphingobacterium lactis]SEG72733.1 TonB-linked outer membrane protein, SusC/RagA family [Sphingobacterium lactis]